LAKKYLNRHSSQPPIAAAQRTVLLMMAKYPQPGQVKTRLAATIGAQAAAGLQQVFIRHLCTHLAACGHRRQLLTSPDERCESMASEVDPAWTVVPQGDGDLGQRMWRAFRAALSGPEPPAAVVMIGADLPTLCDRDIQAALAQLADHDVVLGPACDGGYYLIGLRGGAAVLAGSGDVPDNSDATANHDRYECLFQEVPWGSCDVLAQTQLRARSGQLKTILLPECEDIDTAVQLRQLMQRLHLSHVPRDIILREQVDAVLSQHEAASLLTLSAKTNTN
jgi:uncharacterized protein